jgi:hypothetical protein
VSDPVKVLAIMVHELVHAAGHWDHKAGFKKVALGLGLEGKMTATVAGEELKQTLEAMIKTLPAYPHGSLNHQDGQTTAPKKQGTRMLALTCPGCGYKVRTSAKWIEVGVPQCPCGLDLEPEGV